MIIQACNKECYGINDKQRIGNYSDLMFNFFVLNVTMYRPRDEFYIPARNHESHIENPKGFSVP